MLAALDAAVTAGAPQMELYCRVGEVICERPEKGAAVAAAKYLAEKHPEMAGFSPHNVRRMRDLWWMYVDTPELLAEVMLVNWTQNVVIMEAGLTTDEQRWYLRKTAKSKLSKTELLRMIESAAHSEIPLDESGQDWYTKEKR